MPKKKPRPVRKRAAHCPTWTPTRTPPSPKKSRAEKAEEAAKEEWRLLTRLREEFGFMFFRKPARPNGKLFRSDGSLVEARSFTVVVPATSFLATAFDAAAAAKPRRTARKP